MAGSVLIAIGQPTADEWRDRIVAAIDGFRIADPGTVENTDMGPVIDAASRERVGTYLSQAPSEGARIACDASARAPAEGFFVGPALVDEVTPDMRLFRDEIFGPILSLMRPRSLDEAIGMMGRLKFGNGASIFTSSGAAARQFVTEMPAGMIGVNVGVPAPMALFSFSGWNDSFFGDLHVQGIEGVMFYTRQKCVLSRWDSRYVRDMGW